MKNESSKKKQQLQLPSEWKETYSSDDKALVEKIINWANINNRPVIWLANLSAYPQGSVSVLLAGKYISPPTDRLKRIVNAITNWDARTAVNDKVFVETSVYKLACVACNKARQRSAFMVLSGYVGVGKTTSLEHYTEKHQGNTVMIEGDPGMLVKHFLYDLADALNITLTHKTISKHEVYRLILEKLTGTDYLLIIDEAEKMPRCLETIRRISDKAGIGVVLAGTEYLDLIISNKGRGVHFDQIRSRVGVQNPIIQSLDEDDLKLMVKASFKDTEISNDMFERFKQYSQGSARMLMQNLIPNIKEVGINRGHTLSTKLIDQVAVKTLSLPLYHPQRKMAVSV